MAGSPEHHRSTEAIVHEEIIQWLGDAELGSPKFLAFADYTARLAVSSILLMRQSPQETETPAYAEALRSLIAIS